MRRVRRIAIGSVTTGLLVAALFVAPSAVPASAQGAPAGPILAYGVFSGGAGNLEGPAVLNEPVVGMSPTPDGEGYWLVASDGGVFTAGDAPFEGSAANSGERFVGMSPTPDGRGYVLTDNNGDVKAYGDAQWLGSVQQSLNAPIVGISETPTGGGYWLAAADGGVFAFGDARFSGSMGATALNDPVVGMASTPDGTGYWLVASDGGVFAFGDARFYGAEGSTSLDVPVVGIATDKYGDGYWLAAGDGGVFTFGAVPFHGSAGGGPLTHPVRAIAATPDGAGYWLAESVVGPTPIPTQPQVDGGCYTPEIEPATIGLACADYNAFLENLQWAYWSPTLARATGTYVYNACAASCAEGPRGSVPATVWLTQPVSTSAGVEFSHAHWQYPGGTGSPGPVNLDETLFTDP
jgi:hypothetical protein